MKFVTIDQMDRTDIERALDEAFKAVAAKGPIGKLSRKEGNKREHKRHPVHYRDWAAKRLSEGWMQKDIAAELGVSAPTISLWAKKIREAQQ